jgi:hypothetical protein
LSSIRHGGLYSLDASLGFQPTEPDQALIFGSLNFRFEFPLKNWFIKTINQSAEIKEIKQEDLICEWEAPAVGAP